MVLSPLLGFYLLLAMTLLISFSSSSPYMMWVSLELNMLSFLPIMSSEMGLALENTMKYFLVQSWASIVFLMGIFFSVLFWESMMYLSMLGVMLKLGAAPLHGWFISILKTCSLWVLVFLSSVQKMIPLMILSNLHISSFLMLVFSMSTFLFVMVSLPGAISLNKILALSSMGNLIWFLVSSQVQMKLFMLFMFIYILLLLGVLLLYKKTGLNQFMQINGMVFTDKIMMLFVFMSLGGLPPLLGFLGKLVILKNIMMYMNMVFLVMLIYTSLMILYNYISRMFFLLNYMPSIKYCFKAEPSLLKKTTYLMSVVGFNLFMVMPI
uniref:NADH-ubiquinone oxidoreductase chain 2 n=1 Tax=Calanus hyperboreus TaxID=114069 RepID=K7QLB8_CALHY|nr:NADH dehydrogenase subunit 2 [Calanus hyperboreus]AFU88795.1 NADH dehydrogenase subunit 2 [Calanus hyperboreus]